MSFVDFKEVTTDSVGTAAKFGGRDTNEIMKILNGKIVAQRRPRIANPWIWLDFFDVQAPASAPSAPTDSNTNRLYTDPSDLKIKVRKTGGAIADIENTNIPDSALNQITNRAKLPSEIAYEDEVNTFGDFDNIFRSGRVKIRNPANTFSYSLTGAAITADRTVTYPLLTANDVFVTEAFAQTLTNKTINASNNTITNIGDAAIAAHTSTKITITAKGQLNTTIVYEDEANTFGDFDNIFRSSRLVLRDSDNTHSYLLAGSNLAANRTVTFPLLTANDTLVTEAFAQTLTNKTIAAGSNTISGIADAHITAHTSTKITITAKGQLNSSIFYEDEDNNAGDHFMDFGDIAVPANPAAGTIRLFNDTNTGALSVRKSGGTTVNLETGGSMALNDLSDVVITSAADNQALVFDSGSGNWINEAQTGGGGGGDVFLGATNTYGDFDSIFRSSRLKLTNPANTFNYSFVGSAITAARNITLPLLTGNDVMVTEAFTQTLTNKTLTSPVISSISNTGTLTLPTSTDTLVGRATTDTLTNKTINSTDNTITATSQATGDILKNNGTKFVRLARGTSLQVLRTNSGATDLEWASLDSERIGKSTANGNGSTTVFNIAHGVGSNPTYAIVSVAASGSSNLTYSYTTDSTNIVVTFTSAPSSGTNNVVIYWIAVA